jgi:hypothetical protein
MMTILLEFGVESRLEKEDYLQGASELAEGLVITSRFNHPALIEMTILTAHRDDVVLVAVSRHKGWLDFGPTSVQFKRSVTPRASA